MNIAGPSYQSRSVPISAQRTLNLYPEHHPGGLSEFVLMSWPGLKAWSTGTGSDRGMHVMASKLYKISATTLYEVGADGSSVSRGTITGSDRCSMADNGSIMVIATGSTTYSYTGTTQTLAALSLTFSATTVTYINNQFVLGGTDGNFYVMDAGTTTVNALNTGSGESNPDILAAPYAFNQLLYLVSSDSIEPWDNIGTGNPPFARIDGAIIEGVGTSSPHGIAHTPDAMYMVSPSGIAYRIRGYAAQPITRPGVSKAFQGYTLDAVHVYALAFDAQRFVVFQFPEATWAYNETVTEGGEWFELDDRGSPYLGTSYARAHGKHLFASDGDVLELDFSTYTNDSNYISKERIFAVIAGEQFGKPRQRLEMSKLRLSLEVGVGTTGQGENPQIMVTPSYDGGKTWGREDIIDVGRAGDFEKDVEWHNMHQFKQLVVRLRMTDPVPWNIYGASIDVREAGY